MKRIKYTNWKKFGFEFLSIFIAVLSAFALNNWNENRKAQQSESKILLEISNGLEKDIKDIRLNQLGHQYGKRACVYFAKIITGQRVEKDSIFNYYMGLTRDFISIQNTAGYETLKSKGLELISNDSLRLQIISLYEYDYNALRKLEEEYYEMQYHENYFKEFNDNLAPGFQFDSLQGLSGIKLPLNITTEKKKILLLYLWKIQYNRDFILTFYEDLEKKVTKIQNHIITEIGA